jgi:hypothetical protein
MLNSYEKIDSFLHVWENLTSYQHVPPDANLGSYTTQFIDSFYSNKLTILFENSIMDRLL